MLADNFQQRVLAGARNLLINCANCHPGQSLLIVHENPSEKYYDPELLAVLAEFGRSMGLRVDLYEVPFCKEAKDPDPQLCARIDAADRTLFLARIGDQIRFRPNGSPENLIVSYALDLDMLASDFGTADYRAFDTLKRFVNDALASASDIHVTCPAGTDFRGGAVSYPPESRDVTIKRFPMAIFAPAPATGFHGRIAQVGFLVGTGSQYYHPYACKLEKTLYIHFSGNRITEFEGAREDIETARKHYEYVGNRYGIDPYYVHSWHAGIHPGCSFPFPAARNFERWSGGAFGNPRLLHFHTCGDYPPGEISLNIIDPTVRIDDVAVWEKGILYPDRLPGAKGLLNAFPCAASVFRNPARQIGLGEEEQLAFADP